MKIDKTVELDTLVDLLIGETTFKDADPWASKIRALSKAVTFVENDLILAQKLLAHPKLKKRIAGQPAQIVGITGLPGAGKSTLTNLLVSQLRKQNKSVAVFAVDPSSVVSGGAILGDRIRMQDHFKDPKVFIRSMAARGALGGVSKATRAVLRLASLLQFDYVLVETVGIGQSESEIVSIADTTILVLMPNSGDEIQLMKAGILQLAHIYVINKCDLGDATRMEQEIAENTTPENKQDWCPPVLRTIAAREEGIEELAKQIFLHGEFESKHEIGKAIKINRAKKEVLQNILMLAEEHFSEQVEKFSTSQIDSLLKGETTSMFLAQEVFDKNCS